MTTCAVQQTSAKVLFYDPHDLWDLCCDAFLLPIGQTMTWKDELISCTVLRQGQALNSTDATFIVVIMPESGLDISSHKFLMATRLVAHVGWCFLTPVCSELLLNRSRDGLGFEQLITTIMREYPNELPLLFIAAQDSPEQLSRFTLPVVLNRVLRLAQTWNAVDSAQSDIVFQSNRAWNLLVATPTYPDSFADAGQVVTAAAQAHQYLVEIGNARERYAVAMAKWKETRQDWASLARRSHTVCRCLARDAHFHGDGAEALVRGLAERLTRVQNMLAEDHWDEMPNQYLRDWAVDLRLKLDEPRMTIPVVGVFSTGKTTFFNHLLGETPEGNPPLRMARTHNTALLCHFHYRTANTHNRVVFKWKKEVQLDLILRGCGQVTTASQHIAINPRAIRDFLHFRQTGALQHIRCQFTWGRLNGSHAITWLSEETLQSGYHNFEALMELLEQLLATGEEHAITQILFPAEVERFPIALRVFFAPVPDACEPLEHQLETETDWAWFQGTTHQENQESHCGFAESPAVAWLVEKADVYLDAPLFRLVSLVDTPGLNSISEHHDRLTEECIKNGDAFLLMVLVGSQGWSKAVTQLIKMMHQSLDERNIPFEQHAQRIFVILNWHKRKTGARTEAQASSSVNDFHQTLCKLLHTESPNCFVANLDPDNDTGADLLLLNRPGLPALFEQLQSFLHKQSLGLRFAEANSKLRKAWTSWERDLDDEERRLRTVDKADEILRLEQLLKQLGVPGHYPHNLMQHVDGCLKDINDPIRSLKIKIRQSETKKEFIELKKMGLIYITKYNKTRNEIAKVLPGELIGLMRSLLPAGIKVPDLSFDTYVNQLPVLPDHDFSQRIEDLSTNWPSAIGCFWHRVRNWGKGFGKARSEELFNRYVSQSFDDDKNCAIKAVKTAILVWAERVCNEGRNAITTSITALKTSVDENQLQLDRIAQIRQQRDDFAPAVKRIQQELATIDQVSQGEDV